MKKIGEFFKTCMLGGLFVLLPVLLFYLQEFLKDGAPEPATDMPRAE